MLPVLMKALSGLLLLIALVLPSCSGVPWRHVAHHLIGHHSHGRIHKRPKLTFKPGPWKHARATFYEGTSTSFGMIILPNKTNL